MINKIIEPFFSFNDIYHIFFYFKLPVSLFFKKTKQIAKHIAKHIAKMKRDVSK